MYNASYMPACMLLQVYRDDTEGCCAAPKLCYAVTCYRDDTELATEKLQRLLQRCHGLQRSYRDRYRDDTELATEMLRRLLQRCHLLQRCYRDCYRDDTE
jgi:hypothetical protein